MRNHPLRITMSLIIKIQEPKNSETLILDHVRPGYVFRWEEAHKAYTYHPKNQKEIDEIFAAQRVYRSVWTFIPVAVDGPVTPAPKDAKELAREADAAAELERVNGLLTAATKRIAELKADIEKRDAATLVLKGEFDKQTALIAALKDAPPAKPAAVKAKPAQRAKGTAPLAAAASPLAQPTATDDDVPAE